LCPSSERARLAAACTRLGAWLLGATLAVVGASAAHATPPKAHTVASSAADTITDDRGRLVRTVPRAKRVVALAPHITELVIALGAANRLVAVDPHSDASEAASLARVAAYPAVDPERILALSPDLVMVWGDGLSQTTLARLEALGLRVFVSRPLTLDDVGGAIERLGMLIATTADPVAISRQFRERLSAITGRHVRSTEPSVFVQLWETPLITLGSRSVMADAFKRCGARNVFSFPDAGSQRVSPEAVMLAAPQLVVSTVSGAGDTRWRQLGLVGDRPGQARFLSFVDPLLERPSPRMLDSLERLCAAIDSALPQAAHRTRRSGD